MKLQLDECVPVPLKRHLRGHNVRTTVQCGWSGIRNSTLPKLAAADGFQVFITTDHGFEYQQNPWSPLEYFPLAKHSRRT